MKKLWIRIWALGLFINGLLTVTMAVNNVAGLGFPDTAIRIIGAVQLVGLALLVFGFVKLDIWRFGRK